MASEAGKGSTRRPQQVPDDVVALRWLMAFGSDIERVQAQAKFAELEGKEKLKQGRKAG